jgi:hypothetical protein
MEAHRHLSDEEFESQFAQCTFPAELFSHEAHIRLAWIHISRYGLDKAIENICTQLRAFTRSLGAADKYNHTVTVAAIRAVYHFMLKSDCAHFIDFLTEAPRLKTAFKELMEAHYSTNIFTSDKARKEYLQPDLLPFD